MNSRENLADLAGRVLLSAIFLVSGFGKIGGYAGTAAYMASQGVPGALLPAVIALELSGAALLLSGAWTRLAALALAVFTLLAGVLFHAQLGDQIQQIMFLKNLAIAGGLLILAVRGAGAFSIDARRSAPAAARSTLEIS